MRDGLKGPWHFAIIIFTYEVSRVVAPLEKVISVRGIASMALLNDGSAGEIATIKWWNVRRRE